MVKSCWGPHADDMRRTREWDFGWDFTGDDVCHLHIIQNHAHHLHGTTALHKAYWLPCLCFWRSHANRFLHSINQALYYCVIWHFEWSLNEVVYTLAIKCENNYPQCLICHPVWQFWQTHKEKHSVSSHVCQWLFLCVCPFRVQSLALEYHFEVVHLSCM